MITLTLCIGIFAGMCIQSREYDFPDMQSCNIERQEQIKAVRNGYAVCAPKRKQEKAS